MTQLDANSVESRHIVNGQVRGVDVNPNQVQLRVDEACNIGDAIRAIAADGTVQCETVGGGGPPTGPAGGDLQGTYPNPTIAPDAVGSTEVSALTGTDITDNTLRSVDVTGLTGTDISDGTLGSGDIGASAVNVSEIASSAVRSDEIDSSAVRASELGPVVAFSKNVSVPADQSVIDRINCPAGSEAIAGGGGLSGGGNLAASQPIESTSSGDNPEDGETFTGWAVRFNNAFLGSTARTAQIYVICISS